MATAVWQMAGDFEVGADFKAGEQSEFGPRPLRGKTILAVDDEPTVLATMQRILEREGAAVVTAEDGLDGLLALSGANPAPDLVITDVTMPGLSGPEMVARRSWKTRSVPVLFVSGYPGEQRLNSRLLLKPFTSKALISAVMAMLP